MELRCNHCGSLNLETEKRGTQTAIFCCDCGKWVKWGTKEEIRLLNHKPIRTIEISSGATNGDMIMAMFDVKVEDDFCKSIGIKLNDSNYVQFNKDWWNAPYKGGKEE